MVTTTVAPTQAIVKKPNTVDLAEYFHRPDIIGKFQAVLGSEANAYVQSVLIACTANADLMKCEPQSILRSSLRAASLELSCDPALKQAYLVPINGRAEFWPHYRGLYTLMVRTGKYYAINVTPVREGQRVMQHSTTGIHYLVLENGLMVENDKLSKLFSQGYQDVTDGPNGKKIIGYLAYFETNKGFKKTVYMSMAEIAEHAEMYVPGYHNPKSKWNDPKVRPSMEMKTCFKELLKWADLSGKDKDTAALRTVLQEDDSEREWANDDELEASFRDDAQPEPEPTPEPPAVTIEHPLAPETLRSWLAANVKEIGIYQHTPEQMGLMNGMLTQAFAPDKDAEKIRRSCLRYLWGVKSSKELKGPQVKATLDWLAPVRDSGGAFTPDPVAVKELHSVWTASQIDAGQEKLI